MRQNAADERGDVRPGLHGGHALPVDVRHDGAAGLRNARVRAVGQVGRHGLIRHKAGPLADEQADDLTVRQVADVVARADAAELDERDGAKLNALRLQALPDGGAAVRGVGLHGGGGQTVADGQHDALPGQQVAQDGLIFFVKAAAEVRAGQIFVLAFAHGLHKGIVIFLPEALRHEGEDAVLRGGVVGAEAQQRGRGVARAAAAEAEAGGGLCLEGAEFRALKAKTPARLGLGRCGARYPTASLLRFRADHAAAQDSVFSLVPERFWEENHYPFVQTMCKSKDEYLTRPDLGRRFDEKNQAVLRDLLAGQRVVLAVGDGLSSAAVQANAPDCCAAIRQGLQAQGIELGPVPFIQFCRVGAGDHIGDLTDCEVICLLVGERPGLVTNESMSAYLTYRPHTGIAESCRTVVSNIHRQGVSAVEAGAHIASLIGRILAQKASGIGLREDGA